MKDVEIRKCVAGDEELLALVGKATFLESFAGMIFGQDVVEHCIVQHSLEKYREWLASTHYEIWLAEIGPGQAPIGYVVLTKPDLPLEGLDPKDVEVKRIYVLSRFQGAGIGKRLMETARNFALARGYQRLLLGVYGGNESAIQFYRHMGYREVGTRTFQVGEHTYQDLIMGWDL
ncbi:GNAT family N-acetyltransferase [Luteolibacter pohnpeiensis]|nr:GNAT family N-acetyltransferase [Luteolibacter pohnpeiensis]